MNPARAEPRTLFDKIWDSHCVVTLDGGEALLYVDRCLLHEGSRPAFIALEQRSRGARRPAQIVACADHYVPTTQRDEGLDGIADASIRRMVADLEANAARHRISLIGMHDARQGILHVVAPEEGLVQPGMVIVGGDSHTTTHGAFGTLAFGIGASDSMHVIATQTLWQARPKTMRIDVQHELAGGATAKDLALFVIGRIGTGGALQHAVEFTGPGIRALSMEQRMTLCNLSAEAGAKAGIVAPDETTFDYLSGRACAPSGRSRELALEYWRSLASDDAATFDREISIDGRDVAPMATWGTSPEQVVALDGAIPDPALERDALRRAAQLEALEYMSLRPGQPMREIAVDRVFIGSCTNARIEDLREAAAVLRDRRARVPGIVVPGSSSVKRQAEAEGLHEIFLAAGLEWRDSGCSLCTGVNGADVLAPGERCASTSNRNFPGRQGRGSRTHLVSPQSAAATAVLGRLASIRDLRA